MRYQILLGAWQKITDAVDSCINLLFSVPLNLKKYIKC